MKRRRKPRTKSVLPNSKSVAILCATMLGVSGLLAQNPEPPSTTGSQPNPQSPFSKVSLTIYNRDLGQVRDVRRISLESGTQPVTLPGISPKVDPGTIHIRTLENPDMFQVQRVEYRDDLVDLDRIWERMTGHNVRFFRGDSLITGTLLRASKDHLILRVSTEAGSQIQVFPRDGIKRADFDKLPGDLVTEPTLLVWFENQRSDPNHPVELSYLTEGLTWDASYEAVISPEGSDGLTLDGSFAVKNDLPIGFPDARVDLVAGNVHRSGDPRQLEVVEAEETEVPEITPREFFEYHRYSIDGTVDLSSRSTVLVPFVENVTVRSEKAYVFEGQTRGTRVKTELVFPNRKPDGPGIPLPIGKVRIYRNDEAGQLHFLGEDQLKDIPVGEEVRINIGDAFDLKGKRERILHQRLARNRTRDRIRITLINSKSTDVVIQVRERMYGVWEITSAQADGVDMPYKQEDSDRISFEVPVKAGGQAILEYEVEYGY
jgi:hypothetical protein